MAESTRIERAETGEPDRRDGAADPPATPNEAEFLRAFLSGRDAPCPACRYNLRDLQSGHCPECGLALTLRVNLVDPALGSFLTGIVGLAVGMGFHGSVLAWAVFVLLNRRFGGGPKFFELLPLMVGFASCLAGILFLVKRRTWFIAHSAGWRTRVGLALWLPGVVCFVWFVSVAK